MADMTSGIASYTANQEWQEERISDPERVWKPEELAQVGIEDSPLFDPGTDWFYSNTNTVLLGLVLEQVTGEPIGDLYRERVIEPLGLEQTSFPDGSPTIPDPHARGYTENPGGEEPIDSTDWNPSQAWAAGEMISTVEDLLVYGRALGTGEGLLPPEQQAKRLNSFGPAPPVPEQTYSIGLMGLRGWVGHNAGIPGFNTILFYHPEIDAVIVVEVNTDLFSGDCPSGTPTWPDGPQDIPCQDPDGRIFTALAEALGEPLPPPADLSA
jgi:D-alanyl-D-alanine carboxypeptidase